MIEHLAFQKAAFSKWNNCKWAGDMVTLTVVDAEEGTSTQSGFCSLRLEVVQIRERCLWCDPPEEREKVRHEKTVIHRLRTKKALERRQERRAHAREIAHLQKSINEFGEDEKIDGSRC